MSEPFIAEIQIFAFSFPPRGWAFCNGQSLAIAQNQALFSILGTTYGGNGQTTFALPNLQSRTPVHPGNEIVMGQVGGSETVTLTSSEIPLHNHTMNASAGAITGGSPSGTYLTTQPTEAMYTIPANANAQMSGLALSNGSQPHTNIQPYLVVNFCIALVGLFPSRN
ncbi:MAG: tail fiber protein [Pyrinomonadaceae bacterium]|nr:tail fiber protein [Pyrinomonadaceae bacterium]